MKTKHTPTPWTLRKDGLPELRNQNNIIDGANGELIVYGQATEQDAAFIVRACNAHQDLINALEFARSRLANIRDASLVNESVSWCEAEAEKALATIVAALAKATGEQP